MSTAITLSSGYVVSLVVAFVIGSPPAIASSDSGYIVASLSLEKVV